MVKWISNLLGGGDGEFNRLTRLVAQTNQNILDLLERQREHVAAIREEALTELQAAGSDWVPLVAQEMTAAGQDARRLALQADSLRAVIEKGEQTSRDLSVLLADSKQLSTMNTEKMQRPPAERRELEEEIEALVEELSEQLGGTIEAKPGLREAVLAAVPKARLHPQRPSVDEMLKQVDATANFLGREVADYFNQINETMVALRRIIGLTTLVDLLSDTPYAISNAPYDETNAATQQLVRALAERDLIRHLERQGLRLPGEIKAAAGIADEAAPQTDNRGRRGRDNRQQTPAISEKDELADRLFWEEEATSELLAIAEAAITGPQAVLMAEIAEKFAGREEHLQARTGLFRGQILQARTDFWKGIASKIEDIAGHSALEPYAERFAQLDDEQEGILQVVEQQDEDWSVPVLLKPDQLAEFMQRRDALEGATFNEVMNGLRAEDNSAADRLKLLFEDFRKDQRKAEQRVLDALIPEAFAVVWEASRRTNSMRPYDVQLTGGVVLHEGKIAEMKTGEGKTLVAVAPLYLNGLTARGAHLCTVNEYLIKRDSDWMGPTYKMLGLSIGAILSTMAPWERKAEYMADITYGSNSEFGFDYLRDNIANNPDDIVQRPHNYCIVDEVDNILIDEARTPLIISGASEGSAEVHIAAAAFAKTLRADSDYTVDEKARSAVLTDEGISRAETFFKVDNLYHPDNFQLVYGVDNALKAHALFKRDKDYVLWQEGRVVSAGEKLNPKISVEVVIVDEFTGRMMQGRRYSEGLHEAIEAKEGIRVQAESQTFATITIQNYFRLYPKLAGMTGTAATEAEEFYKIYKLEVLPIPTNKPMIRVDNPDRIYRTEQAKFNAVLEEIREMHEQGRPVLVGTVSIEKSEELSRMLEKEGIPHSVLNAKQHEREASIVAQAGERGVVTIATNMAGRGTDIKLGFGVHELGGLHIVGTERHESRRIDNQLRGRAGRQGDNGSSRFFVSVEDEIMRRSGVNQNIVNSNLFKNLWDESMPIEHSMISRSVEQAQVKMEGFNFDTRKHLVEYDDVVNTQRDYVYKDRRFVLQNGDPRPVISRMIADKVQELGAPAIPSEDGRKRRDKSGPSAYVEMFQALTNTFPEDVIRRLLRSILSDRLTPLAEEGDIEGLVEELKQVSQEAYDGTLETQLKNIDERLQEFYHIGDEYYEIAGGGTLDYNKLARSLGLPLDLINRMSEEETQYDEARDMLYDMYRENYERDQRPRLQKLNALLETEAARPMREGGEEARVRSLIESIQTYYPLSPASAARYVEAESHRGGATVDGQGIVGEVQDQLEMLYGEVEQTLGDVFMETNTGLPLISLVDNRLPRSVYRQIEEHLGAERIEELENIQLEQLPQDVQDVVKDAFVRWQESDLMMRVVDYLWTRHLTTMEGLRHSIGLQAYGQKDPLVQYKVKAYELFDELKADITQLVVLNVLLLGEKAEGARTAARQQAAQSQAQTQAAAQRAATHATPQPARAAAPAGNGRSNGNGRPANQNGGQSQRQGNQRAASGTATAVATPASKAKIGRNDPCFCGSGRKYKHCHGR